MNFHMLSDEPLRWNPFLRKGTVWLLRELESYRFPKKQAGPPVTEGRQGQGKGKPGMLLVVGDGLLDELEELVGGVGAVLDHLQLVGRDPAHAGEKFGDVGHPLGGLALPLGAVEQGELFFKVENGVRLDVERGHFRRKALAHEFLEEAAVFRGEGFRGFLLEHVGGAQEHAQELGDQFGVGVAELLIAHEHGGQAHAAGIGGSGDLPALVDTEEHVRCPQADAVADAAVERREW